jgi:hypothetical protein
MSKPMTAQKVFNKVVKHLRKQGHKALNEKDLCMYLAKDGSKCAFGCLIRTSEYRPEMERKCITWIFDNGIASLRNRLQSFKQLVVDLQYIHDCISTESWEVHFQKVADLHALTYTPPKVKK